MEVESFEDEEVAKLLNDWFVSIKVSTNFCFHYSFKLLHLVGCESYNPWNFYFVIHSNSVCISGGQGGKARC